MARLRDTIATCAVVSHAGMDSVTICRIFQAYLHPGGSVRTTINLDDELLEEARRLTGIAERTALVHEGLRALIQREAARRLARLGGSAPDLEAPPRRRSRAP
jgi:Arc/MetJ family transcription regulator